jgi:hypothetical protein
MEVISKLNSAALIRKRTIPTERPPLVGKVSGYRVSRGQRNGFPRQLISILQTRSRYFSIQVAIQLYSRGWVDAVPDPLPLRKYASARNRTRGLWICSQELWRVDHRVGSSEGSIQEREFRSDRANVKLFSEIISDDDDDDDNTLLIDVLSLTAMDQLESQH